MRINDFSKYTANTLAQSRIDLMAAGFTREETLEIILTIIKSGK